MLLLLPWIVPVVVSATAWKWLVASPTSWVPRIAENIGLGQLLFLDSPGLAKTIVIAYKIWLSFPFMMLMASAALAGVPSDIYEAARVDGASSWQQFRRLTMPMIARSTYISWILMFIFCIGDFQSIYLLTGGGPVNSTSTLDRALLRNGLRQLPDRARYRHRLRDDAGVGARLRGPVPPDQEGPDPMSASDMSAVEAALLPTPIEAPGTTAKPPRSRQARWPYTLVVLVITVVVLIPVIVTVVLSFTPQLSSTSHSLFTLENFSYIFGHTQVLTWLRQQPDRHGGDGRRRGRHRRPGRLRAVPRPQPGGRRVRADPVHRPVAARGHLGRSRCSSCSPSFNLNDNLFGLAIVYVSITISVATWMMAAYIDTIPVALEEAAWIDGCSVFGGFVRIVLRNSLPGILSTAIFAFLLAWNDFLIAVVFLRSRRQLHAAHRAADLLFREQHRMGLRHGGRGRRAGAPRHRVRLPEPLLQHRRDRRRAGRPLMI